MRSNEGRHQDRGYGMNLNKAREYFSAYYEGSLDRGLREGFERMLRADAQAQAEYRAFERTMGQLEAMSAQEAVVPEDLHDRILARIDRTLWESRQRRQPIFQWWKSAILVGAAATALAVAIFQSNPQQSANTAGFTVAGPALKLEGAGGGVNLSYAPNGSHLVVIRDAQGAVLEQFTLKGAAIQNKPLANQARLARTIAIDIDGAVTWVALPGREREVTAADKGDLLALALDIADATGVPVVVQVRDPETQITWRLDVANPHGTATRALEPIGKKVELRSGRDDARVLWILDN